MKMEVQIISKETLKPSPSTKSHPKIFRNSLLDQLIPSRYAPLILYYPTNKDSADSDFHSRINLLKSSLSELLARVYPLAGKIRDNLSIDCDDEGANFVETRVICTLEKFLKEPDHSQIRKFIPCELFSDEPLEGTFVTNVQVNVFKCGGIAVGTCLSHRVIDGDGLRMFLKGWTSPKLVKTDLSFLGSRFPAADEFWLRDSANAMWGSFVKTGSCLSKRFVFDSFSIEKLKNEAIESGLTRPTRVEVVSGVLWKAMVVASAKVNGSQRPSTLNHLVNLRRRFPVTEASTVENSLGNCVWIAPAKHDETEPTFAGLTGKVREALARIDLKFVEKLKGEEGKSVMLKSLEGARKLDNEMDYFGFSSWCNFRYYDVADFGWGKPVWISCIGWASSVFFNLVILVDTKCGKGVEAWITMDEKELSVLEKNPDIVKLASIDPSPLAT